MQCRPQYGDPGTMDQRLRYMKASTTATSRDGILRWWINGVLGGNYTNLNYAPSGLTEWQWNNTWDGAQDMGTSNTVDWEHWLDHVHISIPNCPANCVELPPDLTPPSQVTGAIVTSTTSTGATLSWAPATDNVGVVATKRNSAWVPSVRISRICPAPPRHLSPYRRSLRGQRIACR